MTESQPQLLAEEQSHVRICIPPASLETLIFGFASGGEAYRRELFSWASGL